MDLLRLFGFKCHEKLSDKVCERVAVDIGILMNKSSTGITSFATTNIPPHPSPDTLERVQNIHKEILAAHVKPIYVSSGPAPVLKNEERERQQHLHEAAGSKWIDLVEQLRADPDTPLSDQIFDAGISSRENLMLPTIPDQAIIISWMKSE
eukprot:12330856-Ditylum_brightwellii.AAC.1